MLKEALRKLINKVGDNEVKARLVRRGLSSRTVEELVAGTYAHEPKGMTATALSEECAKEGIVVDKQAAS